MPPRKNLVIISAGKLGREIHSWVGDGIAAGLPWTIKGFLDNRADALRGYRCDAPIIGTAETYVPEENDVFLCAIGEIAVRRQYTELVAARGGHFTTFVHPTARFVRDTPLGPGSAIAPFAHVGADARIGASCMIGQYSCISHDNVLGDYCQLSGHNCFGGNVTVGDGCFLGLSTVVIPGITLGANCFVGVGSVVVRNVAPGTRVFGNPALPFGGPAPRSASS